MNFFSPLDPRIHPLGSAGKATLGETRPPEPFVLLSSAETIIAHARTADQPLGRARPGHRPAGGGGVRPPWPDR
ncbi:MAG: hypothetical protein RLZZ501_2546 [Pseudomonadota bacterium]|jgi:hypothetical protein